MNEQTLKALRASIAHHEKNLTVDNPEAVKLGSEYCALCALFNTDETTTLCKGCPIYEKDKKHRFCYKTPFNELTGAWMSWRASNETREDFQKAEQAEIDFLKSLLPTGEA